jgi:hypothetical protein
VEVQSAKPENAKAMKTYAGVTFSELRYRIEP